ncbi:hypothetical protein [Photobacterium sp. Hal280]|uniref:hypothetical protein n=1 Tax=Photobacterium sp. Hal280 TaxID=3035163 RepID=UPI00301DC9CD
MNYLLVIKSLVLQVLRYGVYVPYLVFYSFVLGPIVGGILMLGGVAVLSLILGPKTSWLALKKAYREEEVKALSTH